MRGTLPTRYVERFALERIIVHQVGERPSEAQAHSVILNVLRQDHGMFMRVVAAIIEVTRVIPILELRVWEKDENGEYGRMPPDLDHRNTWNEFDAVSTDMFAHGPGEERRYHLRFTLIPRPSIPTHLPWYRAVQTEQLLQILQEFAARRAGPDLGSSRSLTFDPVALYRLFTPGRLLQEGVWISETAIIDESAVIFPPAAIGMLTWIGEYSVIGPGCVLALDFSTSLGAVLSRCVILRGSIAKRSMVDNIVSADSLLVAQPVEEGESR